MPIVIEAVSEEKFLAWVQNTKNKFAMKDNNTFASSNLQQK